MIDQAHHRGHAKQALDETVAMDRAVEKLLHMTDERDTLIVVTADHDQGLAFTGYAPRDADILGEATTKINKENAQKFFLNLALF